ncbi:MAG: hypothetical protein IJI98_04765 [Methanosphaera sp.]|nr:hypothetical protein [Methanosphaera sp.]
MNKIMNDEQKKNLVRAIEEAAEWQRLDTSIEGVYVVKPPEYNNVQRVFVELKPTIDGQAYKKKGLYLKTTDEIDAYKKLLENPKTRELVEVISEYYGIRKTPKIEI